MGVTGIDRYWRVYGHVGADLTPYNLNQKTNGDVYRKMEFAGILATSEVTV